MNENNSESESETDFDNYFVRNNKEEKESVISGIDNDSYS